MHKYFSTVIFLDLTIVSPNVLSYPANNKLSCVLPVLSCMSKPTSFSFDLVSAPVFSIFNPSLSKVNPVLVSSFSIPFSTIPSATSIAYLESVKLVSAVFFISVIVLLVSFLYSTNYFSALFALYKSSLALFY